MSTRTPYIFTNVVTNGDDEAPKKRRRKQAASLCTKELPYKALDGSSEVCPAVSISLLNGEGKPLWSAVAIIDSGADWSTFPAAFAAPLGIHFQECVKTTAHTAGGDTTNYCFEPGVQVMIEGEKHHLAANFCKDLAVPVLGRKDFFAIYRVTVDEANEQVTLEPHIPDVEDGVAQADEGQSAV